MHLGYWLQKLHLKTVLTDPHNFDEDPDSDPDPACHFFAGPDSDPNFHFDSDPNPTLHFDADPDPYPRFQIKAQNLEKVLK
jgi:hypothetical protein